jgi:hypothetical protein
MLEFPTTVAFRFADDHEDGTMDLTTSSTLRNLCDKIQATMQQRSEAYQPRDILGAGSWLFFRKKGLPKLHYSDSVLSLQNNKECFQVKKIDTHNSELASQPLSAFTSTHATAIMMHRSPESAGDEDDDDDDDDPTIEKYVLDVIITVGKAATIRKKKSTSKSKQSSDGQEHEQQPPPKKKKARNNTDAGDSEFGEDGETKKRPAKPVIPDNMVQLNIAVLPPVEGITVRHTSTEYRTTSLNAILVRVTLEPRQQQKKIAHRHHRHRASFSDDQDDDDMDDALDEDELDDGLDNELDDRLSVGLSVGLENELDDDKDPWSLEEVRLFVANVVQKKSQYMDADSSSSSLIGQKSGLYYFPRRDSTKGTMILKTRNLWEHINSKRKPHESEVDLLLALGKIDVEADEPMTPRFLAQASPAPPPSTLKQHTGIQPPGQTPFERVWHAVMTRKQKTRKHKLTFKCFTKIPNQNYTMDSTKRMPPSCATTFPTRKTLVQRNTSNSCGKHFLVKRGTHKHGRAGVKQE